MTTTCANTGAHAAGGAQIIMQEAKALEALAASLGKDFDCAVECLLKTTGRIAVTGMGKSGHVAQKVAATLASTGSPAYFIHPAEAAHGDLGMLDDRDVLVAYSNSGETIELEVILQYCARRAITIIGVTKDPNSFLGRQSNIILKLPAVSEACPLGCAPTTSTTMMLALGDALAISLLEARGFTAEDFHRYHPGGKLGHKLLKVADIMQAGDGVLPLVAPDTPLADVLSVITKKRLGCTGVVTADGQLTGMITDGDLRRHMGPDFFNLTAGEVMSVNPVTVTPETLGAKALALMQTKRITNVFAVGPDMTPQGILHVHDCLKAGLS